MSVGCAYISLCWIHSISFPRKPGDSTTLMFTMCHRAIYAYHVTLQLNILDLDLTPLYECRVSDTGVYPFRRGWITQDVLFQLACFQALVCCCCLVINPSICDLLNIHGEWYTHVICQISQVNWQSISCDLHRIFFFFFCSALRRIFCIDVACVCCEERQLLFS